METLLPNPDEMIKPNLSCKLKINDYSNPEALMIPMRIIKENASGKKYIFKLGIPMHQFNFQKKYK